MATISLRIPDEDLQVLKAYAKFHNKTLSEIIRNTMIEKIEDEYDLKVIEEYERKRKPELLKRTVMKNYGRSSDYEV